MITGTAFKDKRYAVLGLARSGLATVETLLASGAYVTAWDRQDEARKAVDGRAVLADPLTIDLAGFDGIVVSPGVPLNTHPIAERAAAAGVPVIGDVELFALARPDLPPHRVVGITGTNGKSTTVALITHLLKQAGVPALMGGNIGLPVLSREPLQPCDKGAGVYVLELSSYQIDLTRSLACEAAGLTNITPDHLDRYAGFEEYAFSKSRLFAMQGSGQFAAFGCGDPSTRAIRDGAAARRAEGRAVCADLGAFEAEADRWPSLQGPHNRENAAIAIAIVRELGLTDAEISAGLASFTGLPHRMERLGRHEGVEFVNDSKATNAASAAPALAAFPPEPRPRVHWIVGGLSKSDGLEECADQLGNVAAAYTIGEAGPMFAELLDGQVPVENCEMLCEAARRAFGAAAPGDVVLLSPACASFDQFRDYEARGEAFRSIVNAVAETGKVRCAQDEEE
ncbi:UDP-N-acetylmuramoyl-L-alanine--D-glutamate ligase [Alteriqipengyuania sp. WL0013]|uniref:UDP-N-acetylmuramoyl-L-alanine--D-glutamate ligase n=1 Tax=Alteriqipengyuania sp. WL0013 TaxID=3110773 RepID=UPI002BB2EA93|nr:UDP-N-acetylmuramoyl-L-alanine--D-glutamate ligase [Alteriqipengyuania sp. WL0013]MEB3415797.1 UDP-N-acetylmuramoyl-L-alanine--D-glutamate ligase [Alteriqipengyuania sp. WL0013]